MKTKASLSALSIIFLMVFAFVACEDERTGNNEELAMARPELPDQPYKYSEAQTGGMPINDNVATLGRVLFYDKQLSLNNAVSCGSCHNQMLGFADGKEKSAGFTSMGTSRNSMHIVNIARQSGRGLFWDMRETELRSMVLKPIQNHVEMGFEKIDDVVKRVAEVPYYKPLFQKAFTNGVVSDENISEALSQFLESMYSNQSKYDQGINNNHVNLTPSEHNGFKLFTQKLNCTGCHSEPDFAPSWGEPYANIGLDLDYEDKGIDFTKITRSSNPPFFNFRFAVPGSNGGGNQQPAADVEGFFKVPSLRNVALTAPYMHDGRFKNLEQVVEHYNSGVKKHKYLNWQMKGFTPTKNGGIEVNDQPIRWDLTPQEKADLVAFLKTLTDYNFVTDPKFSNPFVAMK